MTTGIIDEVKIKHKKRYPYTGIGQCDDMIQTALDSYAEELKAEIEKIIDYHDGCWHIQKGCNMKQELIGNGEKQE